MNDDLPFRIAVAALAIVLKVVRLPSGGATGWKANWPGMKRNPLDTAVLFGMSIAWGTALALYVFFPTTISLAAVGLPVWLRWSGVALAAGGLAVIGWGNLALGRNLNITLQVRENHRLITTGPYRRIRHPIYAAAHGLIAANWLVGLCFLAPYVLLLVTRIPKEERMMLDTFGDEYRQYMKRTGRLLPKIGAS